MTNKKVKNTVREILTLETKYAETNYNELGILALCIDIAEESLYKEDGMSVIQAKLDGLSESISSDGRSVPFALLDVIELFNRNLK